MGFVSGFVRLLVGLVFGVAMYFALSPAIAAFMLSAPPGAILLGAIVLGAVMGLAAPTIRRTFGWGFLALGLAVLALPLTTMLLAGRVTADQVQAAEASTQGATLVGSAIGAGLLTSAAAIIGFFLGAIFLVLAAVLLLGGRREVILVDRESGRAVPATRTHEPRLSRGPAGRIEPPLN